MGWGKDFQRVGFEGNHDPLSLDPSGLMYHPFEDLLVSKVDAIEISDGGNRVSKRSVKVFNPENDFHLDGLRKRSVKGNVLTLVKKNII